MEYLVIISLALVLIVPTFYFFFTTTQKSTDSAVASQIVRMGNEMTRSIEDVYGYGKDAKLTLELSMPPNVQRVYLRNANPPTDPQYPGREIVFEILSEGRTNHLVFFTNVPVQINSGCAGPHADAFSQSFANPGKKNLQLLSCGRNVSLHFT